MQEEKLKLSDLRKPDVVTPRQELTDFVTPANQLDNIIGNTAVEDTVLKSPDALLDGDIAERTQRLNDKKNTFSLLNREYENAEENLVRETQGRGITQLGRRNTLVTRQRVLDSKRKKELANIELLRGNIETSEILQREALALKAKSSKTYQEKTKERYIELLETSGASQEEIESAKDTPAFTFTNRLYDADPEELDERDRLFIESEIRNEQGDVLPSSVRLTSGLAKLESDEGGVVTLGEPLGLNPQTTTEVETGGIQDFDIDPEILELINNS